MVQKGLCGRFKTIAPALKYCFHLPAGERQLEEGRHKGAARNCGPCFVFREDLGCSRSIQTNACIQIRAIPPPTWAYMHSLAFPTPHIPAITQLLGSLQTQRDPGLELQRSQKYPNKLIFIFVPKDKAFLSEIWFSSRVGCVGASGSFPACRGKGWGKDTEAGAGAAAQCSGFGCQQEVLAWEIWEWGKMPALESNLTTEKENSHIGTCRRFIFSLSLFSHRVNPLFIILKLLCEDCKPLQPYTTSFVAKQDTHNFNPREMRGLRQGSQALYLSIFSI